MTYILLSVLASTLVLVIFRMIQRFGADTRHSITISYLISSLTGFALFSPDFLILSLPWFWPAALEGVLFYLVFRLMAKTAQVNGIAVAGIASKMSVVIPVCIGIVFLNEDASLLKILGVMTGFCAVFLSAGTAASIANWRWPVLVFLGTGSIDASLKLFQVWTLSENQFPEFITTIFTFAFAAGLLHHFFCSERTVSHRSIISGIFLGITNFGTVFFVLKALAQPEWESSVIFPINNFGVVAASTIVAVVLFGEKLSGRGMAGLGLAIVSIGLLFWG